MNLLNNVDVSVVEGAAAAAQTELTTEVVDMAGWSGVMFIAHLGDVASGCVLGLVADHSDDDDGGWEDLVGPLAHTADATDADNKVMVLDVAKPAKRYVRARLTRTTADAVVNGIVAVRYGPLSVPVTQGSTVLESTTLANPVAA